MKAYDLVVIGAGPGGYVGAIRAAQLGFRVALVEKDTIGGTCLNRGCIPTKALLHSAELYHEAVENFTKLGLQCEGVRFDAAAMYARKNEVVADLVEGVEKLLRANKVEVYRGTGRVEGVGEVSVTSAEGSQQLGTKHILLATGSRPALPPLEGSHLPNVLTSDAMLENAIIYPRLAIIGAGVIGVEFASLYTALGCEVTLLEAAPRALPAMGREIGRSMAAALQKQGAVLYAGALVQQLQPLGQGVLCTFLRKEVEKTIEADAVLIATGRKPVLEGVVAEGLSLVTQQGFVVVDEQFRTSIQGVFAIGDILAGPQLAHLASAEAINAVEGMAGGQPQKDLSLVPSCIYSQPEIATVGITEEQAAEAGIAFTSNKFLMVANGRTLIAAAGRSYCKLICEQATGKLLGAELVCTRATDIISQLTLAIAGGLTAAQLDGIIYPHPTFAEAVGEAASIFADGAIHAMPKPRG